MSRRSGALRLSGVLAVGAAMVAVATAVPGSLDLTADATQATPTRPAPGSGSDVVTSASLVCPGPETEGLPSVPADPGSGTVLASAAPVDVVSGLVPAAGPGKLTLAAFPPGTEVGATTTRGAVVAAPMTGATGVDILGTGSLAPALAAVQATTRGSGADRGLTVAPCRTAGPDLWLLAGGGDATRRERLVLTNPGANPVAASVQVHGTGGVLTSSSAAPVTVPPRGRVSLLLDALVPPEATPAVHVTATGGALAAVVEDAWVDGTVGRGRDDAVAAATAATDQVVPAVVVAGPARVRIVVPGSEESVVSLRLLTPSGSAPVPGDAQIRIPAGAVRDVDLSAVAPGSYAVQVRADRPVVAAATVERRDGAGPSDLAWTTSTSPVDVVAGTPLPTVPTASLHLAATGEPGRAVVYVVRPTGAIDQIPVTVGTDAVGTTDVSGAAAVWVRVEAGTIRAAVSLTGADAAGPVLGVLPLASSPITRPTTPIRPVRR